MGKTPVNPAPKPQRRLESDGHVYETMVWPFRLITAEFVVKMVAEDGQLVTLRTKLAFPGGDEDVQVIERTPVDATEPYFGVTMVDRSTYHMRVNGTMVADADNTVYTLEIEPPDHG